MTYIYIYIYIYDSKGTWNTLSWKLRTLFMPTSRIVFEVLPHNMLEIVGTIRLIPSDILHTLSNY